MNLSLLSNKDSLLPPPSSKKAGAKGWVLWAILLGFSICSVSIGFVLGWEGSHRLYISTRTGERIYTIQPGDASPEVRDEVKRTLQEFQDGYTSHDLKRLSAFMERLFPNDEHILICGTNPGELVQGRAAVERFIGGDWACWGSVRLVTDDIVISSFGDVAWLATTGTVTTVREGTRPIRFLAVLQRTGDRWMFRQVQYQWDEWNSRPARLSELVCPSTVGKVYFR